METFARRECFEIRSCPGAAALFRGFGLRGEWATERNNMKKIAVLGFGTVGSGVVELFYRNREKIERKAGCPLELGYILDLRDFPDSPYREKFVKSLDTVLADPDVCVVAECMGGVEPAFSYLLRCLERGISAVTSNKELVAQKGAKLLEAAREHSANCFFEASVGGAIPIIRPLHRCLAANKILGIYGILNGTTNFILDKMLSDKMSFESALKLAQDLGYAERDPSADVDGADACRKICILASLSFGRHIYPESVTTQGIRSITSEDAACADALDGAVKLIAFAQELSGGRVLAGVCPAFVPHESLISRVDGVFNCVEVRGDAVGSIYLCGQGAGKFPTASAMMGDIIEAAKHDRTVFSQDWEDAGTQDFVADFERDRVGGMFARFEKPLDDAAFEKVNAFLSGRGIQNGCARAAEAMVIKSPLTSDARGEISRMLSESGFAPVHEMPVLPPTQA